MYTSQPPSTYHGYSGKGPATLRSHYLGPHPIIHYYFERLTIGNIISGCLGTGTRNGIPHAQALEPLIHNILVAPVPLYRLADWMTPIEPSVLGLTERQKRDLNDDRLARTLDALATAQGRSVFFRLGLRTIKMFSLNTDRVHFDTTTVTFFGAYLNSVAEPVICRGYNKDHRPDLKQLLFGLNVVADGAVPILPGLWNGNRTDDTVHTGNVARIRELLGREDFVYVADSKLCTKQNLKMIVDGKGKFVTVLPRTRKEDIQFRAYLRKNNARWRFLMKIPPKRRIHDPPDVFCTCKSPGETTEEGYRLVWVRSSLKAAQDAAVREAKLTEARAELDALSLKLNRGKLKRKSTIRAAVKAILAAMGVKPFLDVQIPSYTKEETRFLRRGRPKEGAPVRTIRHRLFALKVQRKKDRLKEEARTDGVFPITSNLDKRYGKRNIVKIYKYQPYVEKRFSGLKSELQVAPVFIKRPHRAAGLILAYYIAIVIASLIERNVRIRMKKKGIEALPLFPEARETATPTCPRILEPFSGLAWYRFQQGDELVTFPLTLSKLHKTLLDLLEVPVTVYR